MAQKKISAILLGAGNRGKVYTDDMAKYPELYEVVGVAEPIEARRDYIAKLHNIPADRVFADWRDLLALPKMADACIICTMDQEHTKPTIRAIDLGYEILLEKPVAANPEECMLLANYAEEKGVNVLVCHVLRYTPFFTKLKNLIDDGYVGRVMQIRHTEDVGHLHQSHSFVRGNWANSERSTPMILQKCCHDLDILQWLIGEKCTRVQSFGSLTYFTKENCPEGAPVRCTDGCPAADTCHYHAEKVYLSDDCHAWMKEAVAKCPDPTKEQIAKALRENNFGKCVFRTDNDVVDHQVVNMEFEGGATASLSMAAFNQGGRDIYVMGTDGSLHGRMKDPYFTYFSFKTGQTTQIPIEDAAKTSEHFGGGHGGGDQGIVSAFFSRMKGTYKGKSISSIRQSVDNHLMAFAAEKSRIEGSVISLADYCKELNESLKSK
ncbi:MAG: Gfo/Idh/MocA family oxidoreductase [Ruminococcaceae bacterium]|nr:Gfo/Idh/MocA family oxidoreductase [Oscillospiraceae bacterium]